MNIEKNEQLNKAIYLNNLSEIRQIIKDNPEILNNKNQHSNPFLVAIYQNNLEIIKSLKKSLKIKIDDITNSNESTALHIASYCGHKNIVEYLIDNGANINSSNKNKITPLFIASYYGYFDIVQILVENGANMSQTNINGESPMFAAASSGKLSILQYLQKKNADFNQLNNNGENILFAAINSNQTEIAQYIIQNMQNPHLNKTNNNGSTALHLAIKLRNTEIVKLLIQNNANIDIANNIGETPLSLATKSNQFEISKMLIDSNAAISFHDANTRDPIYIASHNKNHVIALALIKNMSITEIENYKNDEILKNTPLFNDILQMLNLELESKKSYLDALSNKKQEPEKKIEHANNNINKYKIIDDIISKNTSEIDEYITYLSDKKDRFNKKIANLKDKGVQKNRILKYFTNEEINECSEISEKLNKAKKYLSSIEQMSFAEGRLKTLLNKAVDKIKG